MVEEAYRSEAMALHIVENVVSRCAGEYGRESAVVERIIDAEMRQSPLSDDPDVSYECRVGQGIAMVSIRWRDTRLLASVAVPLSQAPGEEGEAPENTP